MDGTALANSQWDSLIKINVSDAPLICLLGLNATKWPSNFSIYCPSVDGIRKIVAKLIDCRFPNKN